MDSAGELQVGLIDVGSLDLLIEELTELQSFINDDEIYESDEQFIWPEIRVKYKL